jgi:hypothetical protein
MPVAIALVDKKAANVNFGLITVEFSKGLKFRE